MPDMSGLELQSALARGGNPLPVIFLTGHGDISSCVDAMKHGAEDYPNQTGEQGAARRRRGEGPRARCRRLPSENARQAGA